MTRSSSARLIRSTNEHKTHELKKIRFQTSSPELLHLSRLFCLFWKEKQNPGFISNLDSYYTEAKMLMKLTLVP